MPINTRLQHDCGGFRVPVFGDAAEALDRLGIVGPPPHACKHYLGVRGFVHCGCEPSVSSILRLVFRRQAGRHVGCQLAANQFALAADANGRGGRRCAGPTSLSESLHSEKLSGASVSPPKAGASGCILGFRRLFCARVTRARRERARRRPLGQSFITSPGIRGGAAEQGRRVVCF
jgi:hypothetical protein